MAHRLSLVRSRGTYVGVGLLLQQAQRVLGILMQLSRALQDVEVRYFFPRGEIQTIEGKAI